MTPSERWPALLLQLDDSSWQRAVDLAHALGVSERTVYRDVQDLIEAGVPLQGVPGKGYRLPSTYLLDPVTLTTDEAVMLVLGSAYAAQNFDGRYRAAARSAQRKLRSEMPPDAQEQAFSLQGSIQLVPPSVFGNPAEETLLRRMRLALLEERTVRIRRRSSATGGGAEWFRPYGLVRQNANWRVVGLSLGFRPASSDSNAETTSTARDDLGPIWSEEIGEMNDDAKSEASSPPAPEVDASKSPSATRRVASIRLMDIENMEVTDETFDRPSGYQTPSGTEQMPRDRTVRVVFSAEATPLVQVGPSMHVEASEVTPTGRLHLTLRVFHELEVMPWLLSWGRHVEVLQPRALSQRIAAEARSTARLYQQLPALLDDDESPSPSDRMVS
jgi:predicted DNA-binding transcriptional regulator YafY